MCLYESLLLTGSAFTIVEVAAIWRNGSAAHQSMQPSITHTNGLLADIPVLQPATLSIHPVGHTVLKIEGWVCVST